MLVTFDGGIGLGVTKGVRFRRGVEAGDSKPKEALGFAADAFGRRNSSFNEAVGGACSTGVYVFVYMYALV
jgi:hypothetical protein